jgi:hypothetical protein
MKFIKWFAGFFEDTKGSASSKRASLYITLIFFYIIIKGSLDGKTVDQQVLFMTTGLILFLVGAVTSEYFTTKKE